MSAEALAPLTALVLRRRKAVRRDRLRFGEAVRVRRTGRGERTLWFPPGALFCAVSWRRGAYGTASWRLFVARAGRPGEALTRLPGVRPGAEALAVFRGVERVRRALRSLKELERAGLVLSEIPPAWWRRFGVRVLESRAVAPPSDAQLSAARMRRRALS